MPVEIDDDRMVALHHVVGLTGNDLSLAFEEKNWTDEVLGQQSPTSRWLHGDQVQQDGITLSRSVCSLDKLNGPRLYFLALFINNFGWFRRRQLCVRTPRRRFLGLLRAC